MPEIAIQHVVSCSSADKNNPAENLLKSDGTHKWKSAAAGEKSVSCVLQLHKSTQIHSIDIGNEGSAFVEVLVGKATAAADQDFEVLLVASAFMSPLESRDGTNRNGVRMFGPDKLNKTTASQKWDRVKIVCTQPFTKLSQYGLSFITFHSPPGDGDGEPKVKKLGAFTLKDADDDNDDDIHVGSVFAKRKDTTPPPVPKGASAIRAASRLAEEQLKTTASTSSPSSTKTTTKRPAASPPASKAVTGPKRAKADSDTEEEREDSPPPKPGLKKQSTSLSSVASSTASATRGEKSALKRSKTEAATPSPAKAFSKLMEKVVFVLSGFENPYRGELRDKALEMGATYKPNWGRGCTHLVCAFTNTPKYQQVAGKGKIVTKSWILDCHKHKKLLPWRKYRLGDAESPDESSDEEEVIERRPRQAPARKSPPPSTKTTSKQTSSAAKKGVSYSDDSDSGGNTEDELRKAEERAKGRTKPGPSTDVAVSKKQDDPYGGSTDEDENEPTTSSAAAENQTKTTKDDGSDSGLPDLPEFFTDKHFFFYGDFDSTQQRLLTRYIAAFNGEVEDYMSKKVNYVITNNKWDDNFEEALSENSNLIFVKPKWIFVCHEKNKLVPYQPHIVVP